MTLSTGSAITHVALDSLRVRFTDDASGTEFAIYTIYVGFSSRRFSRDLRDAFIGDLINTTPHFNSVNNYLAKPELTEVLKGLVTLSSLTLKSVETTSRRALAASLPAVSCVGSTRDTDGRQRIASG